MVISLIIIFKVLEPTDGPTAGSTKENGYKIKYTEKEYSLGLTEDITKVNTEMTKRKVTAYLSGLTVGSIKGLG
jgi:hypothetical protein